MSYFHDHSLPSCDQSAFRRGHSTTTAAHKLFDDLLGNINEGLINGSCFLDLKKCFDTIDHKLLIIKPNKYGIRGAELLWFEDYLNGRSQAVAINGSTSHGVPQGSVLGPLLFLVFINDLPECLNCTASNIYADDTEIHSCGNTISEVSSLLQQHVNNVVKWLKDNKLVLNGDKSFCMLTSSNRNIVNEELDVCIDGVRIEQVYDLKYLGTHPDSMLTLRNCVIR